MKKIIVILTFIIFTIFNSYSLTFVGRAATFIRDASGDSTSINKYKNYKYVAASYNFKIGEEVTVTNFENNKSIKVIISDYISQPTGYMLYITKDVADELEIEWKNDVYVAIDAEGKSINKDSNIREISTEINDSNRDQFFKNEVRTSNKKSDGLDYLFVNSYPIRARLIVNGQETNYFTPFVLKNSSFLKNKFISLRKDGYKDYPITQEEIMKKNFDAYMVPISFDLYFPEKIKYNIGATEVNGPVYITKLDTGRYDITVLSDKLTFKRVPNFAIPEAILGTAFGFSFAAMAATIATSEVFNAMAHDSSLDSGTRNDYKNYTIGVDYAKFGAIGAAATFGVALVAVIIVDAVTAYLAKKEKMQIATRTLTTEDSAFYDTAMNFLAAGEIEKSTNVLLSILSLFPNSDIVPKTYYMIGQNYFINNDFKNAEKYWETFIRDYPIYDYYDYVLKSLADIYYGRKEYKQAVSLLDRIVFTDNVINRESVYSSIAKIDYDIYMATREEPYYNYAEFEYLDLINMFISSERLDLYFLQLINLYKHKNEDYKIQELKAKAMSLDDRVSIAMKNAILSYFR